MLKTSSAILLVFLAMISISNAQFIFPKTINVTGNTYTQGQYSIDWSIGELAIVETLQPANYFVMITNGLLQPHTKNGAFNTSPRFADGEIIILPNPTRGKIEINFQTRQMGDIIMVIYDANGKQVYSNSIQGNGLDLIQQVDLTRHAAGSYYLYVELKPFPGSVLKQGAYKIIKTE